MNDNDHERFSFLFKVTSRAFVGSFHFKFRITKLYAVITSLIQTQQLKDKELKAFQKLKS